MVVVVVVLEVVVVGVVVDVVAVTKIGFSENIVRVRFRERKASP